MLNIKEIISNLSSINPFHGPISQLKSSKRKKHRRSIHAKGAKERKQK
jgi:hypothetical protein